MKRISALIVRCSACVLAALALAPFALLAAVPGSPQKATPANPNASPEARALLDYMYSISGRYTVAGQHNFSNSIARWTDRAYDLTGKYPGLFGQDFGFEGGDDKDSIVARPAMVEEAKRQYQNGAIITLTWHAVRPTSDEPVSFRDNIQSHLTDFEWSELLTPGSDLNKRWCAQVDLIAGYLKQLRDARVPVLWRPYHEVNANWFWWGGRPGGGGSAALYRQMFDRFVNYHKLNNLVWVWNVNAPGTDANGPGPYSDYFPGLEYADLLSVDIYGDFKQSHYDDLVSLAAGKPVALGEVGVVPTPEVLRRQPKWTYFMVWSDLLESNPPEALRAIYGSPAVLTRADPALSRPLAEIRKAPPKANPEPVTDNASPVAKALLNRLYSAADRVMLSGQQNDPRSVCASTTKVFALTSKYPSIYGQELAVSEAQWDTAAARAAIVAEARRQHQNQAVVSFTWHPERPTDEEPGTWDTSVRGKLTDFEWNQLLTPGTNLYKRWAAQVDELATSLKRLQANGVPVLWHPYPEPNGSDFWWAGRKGARGSAALYRQLFDRLVAQDNVRNLIWVWDAAAPGVGPAAAGPYADYFPGFAYVDGLSVRIETGSHAWRPDGDIARFALGKVVGVEFANGVPDPASFPPQTKWAWFLVAPFNAAAPPQDEAYRKLYADPRILVAQRLQRTPGP